jgi:hypothetical protein
MHSRNPTSCGRGREQAKTIVSGSGVGACNPQEGN